MAETGKRGQPINGRTPDSDGDTKGKGAKVSSMLGLSGAKEYVKARASEAKDVAQSAAVVAGTYAASGASHIGKDAISIAKSGYDSAGQVAGNAATSVKMQTADVWARMRLEKSAEYVEKVIDYTRPMTVVIPSREGKTTLADKYPGVFADADVLVVSSATNSKTTQFCALENPELQGLGMNKRMSSIYKCMTEASWDKSTVLLTQDVSVVPSDSNCIGPLLMCSCDEQHPHSQQGQIPSELFINPMSKFWRRAAGGALYFGSYEERDNYLMSRLGDYMANRAIATTSNESGSSPTFTDNFS